MKKLGKFIWSRSHNGIYLLSKNSVSLYIIPEEIPHVQGQRRSPSKTVQFSWVTQSCLTLCDPMNRSMPGLPVHHQLPEFTQTHVHWVGMQSSRLILCRLLLLLPSIFPSIRVFSNESALRIRWPKYWSFNKGNRLIFLKLNPEHVTPLLFCAFSKFHASANAAGLLFFLN